MSLQAELSRQLERSRALGFLGPGELDGHLLHAEGFIEVIRARGPFTQGLDLGSGGGLPGLVVAVELPELSLTLLDANERRVAFLRDAIRHLGLGDRVSAVVGRAEVLAHTPGLRARFPLVVARSFGAPAVTAECGAGFLAPSGIMLVSEPSGATDRWPAEGLAMLGMNPGPIHHYAHSTIRELARTEDPIPDVPRAVGLPAKRPRFG